MRWKYFCRWNSRKYDYVRYITCKSLYKNTKDKSTKEITRKTKTQKKKFKNTKDKIAKDKFQETKESKKHKTSSWGISKTPAAIDKKRWKIGI